MEVGVLTTRNGGQKTPLCLGAPPGFTGKVGLFWRLKGECFPFPVWFLEAVGISWLVVKSHQSLLPSTLLSPLTLIPPTSFYKDPCDYIRFTG